VQRVPRRALPRKDRGRSHDAKGPRRRHSFRDDDADSGRCIVPKLLAGSVAGAKLTLKNHSCRLGKVTRHNPRGFPERDLSISHQSAPAGKVLAHNARVAVTVTF
jgi:hypothetical protein